MERCLCGCGQLNNKHGFLLGHHKNPMKGKKHSQETKNKISKEGKGRKFSKEHNQKVSNALIKFWSIAENKERMKECQKGKIFTEEHKRKISENHADLSGPNHPLWNIGHTEETKKKISKIRIENKIAVGPNNPNWQGGLSFLPYCYKFNNTLKNEIRKRDNYQCQYPDCLITQLESLIIYQQKLSIHHIHYDKPNCEPDLISLCIKHNAQANFDREYHEQLYIKILKKRNL